MYNYHSVSFKNVNITGGFWHNKQRINKNITAEAVYSRFSDTHRFEALSCNWREGFVYEPHIYWDSDVAKWLEGAAYILAKEKNERLEQLCDKAIADIVSNQEDSGYFNSHFLVMDQGDRFKVRRNHELYCAGHLMEAACAYYEATGKDAFLKAMCRYADYIYDTFYVYQRASFVTGGHPEVELALVKLADTTGNAKYLELAKFFVDMRGNNSKDTRLRDIYEFSYDQSHRPLKEQDTAEGHAVRAQYIYAAMADIADRYKDDVYYAACEKLFSNIVQRRMYITGATGSTYWGEAFTVDYDLPNKSAYGETCASIGLGLFARRMQKMKPDAKYADAVERVMYNGALSGVSLDGNSFFYSNLLELDPTVTDYNPSTTKKLRNPQPRRSKIFNTSCCPPNIMRFIASIADNFYTYTDDTVFIHQYAESTAQINGNTVTQKTNYPVDGEIRINLSGGFKRIAVRIPGWCENFCISGPYTFIDGYAYIEVPQTGSIMLSLDMSPQLIESNPKVQENAGRVAVMRGPIVYCAEGIDNGRLLRSLLLIPGNAFEEAKSDLFQVPVLTTIGLRKEGGEQLYRAYKNDYVETRIKLIPYFGHANRGVSEMVVWLGVQEKG